MKTSQTIHPHIHRINNKHFRSFRSPPYLIDDTAKRNPQGCAASQAKYSWRRDRSADNYKSAAQSPRGVIRLDRIDSSLDNRISHQTNQQLRSQDGTSNTTHKSRRDPFPQHPILVPSRQRFRRDRFAHHGHHGVRLASWSRRSTCPSVFLRR